MQAGVNVGIDACQVSVNMLLISVDAICCCETSPEKTADASEETLAELSRISTTFHT